MNIERMIEFDKIKEYWKNLAITEHAKEKINQLHFYLSEDELRKNVRDTTNARTFIEMCGTPPLSSIDEVKEIVMQATKDGCLTPYQLERTERVLVTIRRLKDYLSRGKTYENALAYYEENLDAIEGLQEEISRQIRGGEVDDYASKELLRIRGDISKTEDKIKQKAEQVIRANKSYMADSYSTLRNSRICIPVKKEYYKKIPGNVIDKSSTGNTVFMEPKSVADLYEKLQVLKISEDNEVYRILYTLTGMVAESASIMEANIVMVEKLDFIFSKGKLSIDFDASEPHINLKRHILLKDARHPLMEQEISVPLQFEIGNGIDGVVITGPNTGGKTVAIKTVALNCMMAQCGLHVTCKEADICMNSVYLCDIGDGQSLTENLSTFSSHIKNVLEIIQDVDKDGLVIMDELGSGTDPTEGMGIAVAVLEELRKSGCLFLVTTHYPEVKEYAQKVDRIINARMEFDRDTLMPTYRLVIGEAGESCAFHIARKLGMSHNMLKTAIGAAYGKEAIATYHLDQRDERKNIESANQKNRPKKEKRRATRINKTKKIVNNTQLFEKFHRGDSVMVYPDKKIGIVCEPINEKGILCVQMPDQKIWINHKRVKMHVSADKLYPEDYDFSIVFDTVEQRKMHHDMERKYVDEKLEY